MKQPEVVSLGNMLVEIMRVELDARSISPPRSSGRSQRRHAHLHLAVARLGHSAGFIGAVGADDSGAAS